MADTPIRLNEPTEAELSAVLPEIAALLRTIKDAERAVLAASGMPTLLCASAAIEAFSRISDADLTVRRALSRARQVAA